MVLVKHGASLRYYNGHSFHMYKLMSILLLFSFYVYIYQDNQKKITVITMKYLGITLKFNGYYGERILNT